MHFLPFFFGSGQIRYWYICFYLLGIPIYIFGTVLLAITPEKVNPDTREYLLTIFSFGYLLLGVTSLISTLLYAKKTNNYFKAFFIFLGVQVLFWMIGGMLGNNYLILSCYFFLFLVVAIYGNLLALSHFNPSQKLTTHKQKKEISN